MKKSRILKNKKKLNLIVLTLVLITALLAGCTSVGQTGEIQESDSLNESGEEHGNEGSSESGGEGESGDPSSPILALDESWDGVVNGIRTAMSYDSAAGAFSGIIENTTNNTIRSILIELNLKKGTKTVVELGPYPVGDLAPGEQATVELLVSDEPLAVGVKFDAWEIHPEAEGAGEGGNEAGGEQHDEGSEGSESGSEGGVNTLTLSETYDVVKNGARLILAYDEQSKSFIGTVENTTNNTLTRVRIEVHLSNGTELGPTTPTDLAPGEKINVKLPATTQVFDTWVTHAEVGSGESGSEGSESGAEHNEGSESSESGGEH